MKKQLIIAVTLILCLLFTVCGCGEKDYSEDEESFAQDFSDGIVIGMSLDNAPFGWVQKEKGEDTVAIDNEDGYAGGFDVKIAKAIGDDLDADIIIKQIDRDELISELEDGDIDLMISGVNPLEARADRVDFSDSYFQNDFGIIVLKDGKYANETSLKGFKGARLSGITDSYGYTDVLPQLKKCSIVQPLTRQADLRVALSNGIIDGFVATRAQGMSACRLHPEYTMILFDGDNAFETEEEYTGVAVGVTKDNTLLLEAVNGILSGISEDKRNQWMERAVYAEPLNQDDEEED